MRSGWPNQWCQIRFVFFVFLGYRLLKHHSYGKDMSMLSAEVGVVCVWCGRGGEGGGGVDN